MPRHAILRLLETFFRHPVLHLIPLIAFLALGGWYASSQEETYQAGGVVLVDDQTLLSSLTGLRGSEAGLETPAQYTSNQLNALLQTDTFVLAVAKVAGVGDATTLTGDDLQEVRQSLGSWATGRDLVYVWSEHANPQVARDLADASIRSLIDWKIDSELTDSVAAEDFLSPVTERYREELVAAREALADYLRENPAPGEDDRPAVEQVAIENLEMAVTDAEVRYTEALSNEEAARLAAAQAESDIRNQLRLLDAPTVPTAPETSLRNLAVALLAFLAVGAMLSIASIVVGTLADRTLRFREDIDRLGLETLAQIPSPGKNERKNERRPVSALP